MSSKGLGFNLRLLAGFTLVATMSGTAIVERGDFDPLAGGAVFIVGVFFILHGMLVPSAAQRARREQELLYQRYRALHRADDARVYFAGGGRQK